MALPWPGAAAEVGARAGAIVKCQQVREQLADYSAGFMDAELRQRLQRHLAACRSCRAHLAQLRELDSLVSGERLAADEALVQRIMAQVREQESVRRLRRRYLVQGIAPIVLVLTLAAAVIVVIQPQAASWAQALSASQVDWDLSAQPEWALVSVGGLCLMAALATWLTGHLARALTPDGASP